MAAVLKDPEPEFTQDIQNLSQPDPDAAAAPEVDLDTTKDPDAVALSKALETDTVLKHRREIQTLIELETGSPGGLPEDIQHAYIQEVHFLIHILIFTLLPDSILPSLY